MRISPQGISELLSFIQLAIRSRDRQFVCPVSSIGRDLINNGESHGAKSGD